MSLDTDFSYDDVNRLTGINYADTTPDVTFTYDKVGNRKTMIDSTGTTTYTYDALYRLTSVKDGSNQTVSYGYDAAGNRTRLTYPSPTQVVTYTYDEADRLRTVTDWNNGQFGYNYDNANRLTELSRPNVVTSYLTYDDAGWLTQLTHQTLTETLASYAYELDNVGNRTALTETLVTPLNIPLGTYLESNGLVVAETENFGRVVSNTTHTWLTATAQSGYTGTAYLQALPDIDLLYQTDAFTTSPVAQYPIHFTTPGTYTLWNRGYASNAAGDSLYVSLKGQLTSVTGSSATTGTGFVPGQWQWANGATTGQPATLSLTTTGLYTLNLQVREDGLRVDRLLLTTDPTYVPTGTGPAETVRQTDQMAPLTTLTRTITYTYDRLQRLIEAGYTTQSPTPPLLPSAHFHYAYDALGNQTALTETIDSTVVTTYTYNAANQLSTARASSDGIVWHYTYDKKGNLLRQTPGGTTPAEGEIRYSYNTANHLVQVELYSGGNYTTLSEAEYNGDGERLKLVTWAVGVSQTVTYVLDQAGQPLVATQGSTSTHYLPGQTNLLAEYQAAWSYPLLDGTGSLRQSVNSTRTVTLARTYKPFGGILEEQGPYETAFGFMGAQLDRVSGLLYGNGRYYDPATGRFLTPSYDSNPYHPRTLNPYVYSLSLIIPLATIVILRRQKHGRSGFWHVLVLILIMEISVTLISCGNEGQNAQKYRVGNIPGVPLIPLENWVAGGSEGINWEAQNLCNEAEEAELL